MHVQLPSRRTVQEPVCVPPVIDLRSQFDVIGFGHRPTTICYPPCGAVVSLMYKPCRPVATPIFVSRPDSKALATTPLRQRIQMGIRNGQVPTAHATDTCNNCWLFRHLLLHLHRRPTCSCFPTATNGASTSNCTSSPPVPGSGNDVALLNTVQSCACLCKTVTNDRRGSTWVCCWESKSWL